MNKKDVESLKKEVIEIHDKLIKILGGEEGIRDDGGLYYCAYKILFHLHKTKDPFSIGAFVLQDLAQNHYFFDGNKRTAFVITKYVLLKKGYYLLLSYDESLAIITQLASYIKMSNKEIKNWLKNNSKEYEKVFKERRSN